MTAEGWRSTDFPGQPFGTGDAISGALHSVHADRIQTLRDHTDLARLAREAAADIDRGHPVEGLRRLVAIGGLAKACADRMEAQL